MIGIPLISFFSFKLYLYAWCNGHLCLLVSGANESHLLWSSKHSSILQRTSTASIKSSNRSCGNRWTIWEISTIKPNCPYASARPDSVSRKRVFNIFPLSSLAFPSLLYLQVLPLIYSSLHLWFVPPSRSCLLGTHGVCLHIPAFYCWQILSPKTPLNFADEAFIVLLLQQASRN